MSFFFIDDAANAAGTLSKSYLGSATSASSTATYTFNSQPFSTAYDDRYIIVGISHGGTDSETVSSVTIGGEAATLVANVVNGSGGTWQGTSLAIALVPAGTTGTISVVMTGSQARCTIDIYAVYALNSMTPVASISDADGSNPQTGSLATTSGGVAIGVAADRVAGTFTWSGLTEDSDYQYDGSARTTSAASALTSGATISVSSTFSTSVSRPSLSAASWR